MRRRSASQLRRRDQPRPSPRNWEIADFAAVSAWRTETEQAHYRGRFMSQGAARAKAVFLAGTEIADPAERVAYLDRECGGDAELRADDPEQHSGLVGARAGHARAVDRWSV